MRIATSHIAWLAPFAIYDYLWLHDSPETLLMALRHVSLRRLSADVEQVARHAEDAWVRCGLDDEVERSLV